MKLRSLFATAAALALLAAPLLAVPPASAETVPGVCELISPDNPTSAASLGQPWRMEGCSESDTNNATFVQATIFDPATGKLAVYSPLVVTDGTSPAIAPAKPAIPSGAIVALWAGANNTLRIGGSSGDWVQASHDSPFGQQAYYNVVNFDKALNAAHVAIPPLGTAVDGKTCPTSRDWSIVDQDPSDNTTTDYLMKAGKLAQDTPANMAALGITALVNGSTGVVNGSDERSLGRVQKALGCAAWKVPDLADPTGKLLSTDGLLNEFQAAAYQAVPVALVPPFDPFTLVNGQPNLAKLNLYRAQVDQPPAADLGGTAAWCQNLRTLGVPRLKADQGWTQTASSPFPTIASNLYTFLGYRLDGSWNLLGCDDFVGPSPVTLTMNSSGVVVGATYQ